MKSTTAPKRYIAIALYAFLLVAVPGPSAAQQSQGAMAYTVSMPEPANHLFHVVLRVEGLRGEIRDFKMPGWHPGYYRLIDYAASVSNFRAYDSANKPLPWEKTTKNTWRVATGNAPTVFLSYDVFGNTRFAAQNYLDEDRAFIAPTGMFLYLAGELERAVSITVELPAKWTRIATGLEEERPRTFRARNFDELYDSPMLLGNQETLEFEVQGKRHTVALEDVPATVDRNRIVADLQRIVDTTARLIGDIDYAHYAFLMMGRGAGGIEHANSSANAFNGASLVTPAGYLSWLSFISHEYFHSYNVKRIRPLTLGPFDYDTENVTELLWVSEGLSVYYQDLMLVRAGLMTRDQYLDKMKNSISSFENLPGRRYQSATDSSRTTWGTSGVGNDRNTTISYYNNGAMLGAMLDLKIRNATANRRSLDDVMRALYNRFHKEKQRGFTSEEFREVCESIAGTSLTEIFEYASTTKDVDYDKYFDYAGLDVRFTASEAPGSSIGLNTQLRGGRIVVAGTSAGSPAEAAALMEGDVVLDVDGTPASAKAINDMLAAKSPGDTTRLKILRSGSAMEAAIVLGKNTTRRFEILHLPDPGPLETEISRSWLRTGP
jgi:predicted metalloprotease with PDZ domain